MRPVVQQTHVHWIVIMKPFVQQLSWSQLYNRHTYNGQLPWSQLYNRHMYNGQLSWNQLYNSCHEASCTTDTCIMDSFTTDTCKTGKLHWTFVQWAVEKLTFVYLCTYAIVQLSVVQMTVLHLPYNRPKQLSSLVLVATENFPHVRQTA